MGYLGKDIKGPWSKPVDLKVSGIDPGHIVDKQGNRYLYVDKGEVIRLTEDGLSTIGKSRRYMRGGFILISGIRNVCAWNHRN